MVEKKAKREKGEKGEKKPRKPYVITKPRENWTPEEHQMFLDSIKIYERDWKMINTIIKTKSVIQIRSHAQKHFLKLAKAGKAHEIPPPRPKKRIPSAADLPTNNIIDTSIQAGFAHAPQVGAWIPGNLMGMQQLTMQQQQLQQLQEQEHQQQLQQRASPSIGPLGISVHAPLSIANSLTGLAEIDSHSAHHLPEMYNLGFGADLSMTEMPMPPPPQPEATSFATGFEPVSEVSPFGQIPTHSQERQQEQDLHSQQMPEPVAYEESTFSTEAAASKQLPSEWLEEAAPLPFPKEAATQPTTTQPIFVAPQQPVAANFQKVYSFISNVVDHPLYDDMNDEDMNESSFTSAGSFESSRTLSNTTCTSMDSDMECSTYEVSSKGMDSMSQEQDEIFGMLDFEKVELQSMGSVDRGMVNHMMENHIHMQSLHA